MSPDDMLQKDIEDLDDTSENIRVVDGEPPLKCLPSVEVCGAHLELVKVLRDLVIDIKWMIQLGRWSAYIFGGAVALFLPFLVGFIMHSSDINSKIAAIEAKMLIAMGAIEKDQKVMQDVQHMLIGHISAGDSKKVEKGFGGQ